MCSPARNPLSLPPSMGKAWAATCLPACLPANPPRPAPHTLPSQAQRVCIVTPRPRLQVGRPGVRLSPLGDMLHDLLGRRRQGHRRRPPPRMELAGHTPLGCSFGVEARKMTQKSVSIRWSNRSQRYWLGRMYIPVLHAATGFPGPSLLHWARTFAHPKMDANHHAMALVIHAQHITSSTLRRLRGLLVLHTRACAPCSAPAYSRRDVTRIIPYSRSSC